MGGCCPGPAWRECLLTQAMEAAALTLEGLCLLPSSSPVFRLTVIRFSEARSFS